MSVRTARFVSRVILIGVIGTIGVNLTLMLAAGDRVASDHPVVVGDPDAPGMADLKAELLRSIQPGDRFGQVGAGDFVFTAIIGTIALAWAVTGSLIVSRQPRNGAGWIFCLTSAAIALAGFASVYAVFSVKVAADPLPGQDLAALISEYAFALVATIPLLVLFFPDGRPPSPRWRWATRVLLAGLVISVTAYALTPGPLNNLVETGILYANPLGVSVFAEGEPANALVAVGVLMILGAGLASVVAAWQRFRRAHGEARQQMRWLIATATLAGIGIAAILLMFPVGLLLSLNDEDFPEWLWIVFFIPTALAIFIGIPAAYLVAIFRYRLWDLDVVVKKTAVALVLSVVMIAVGIAVMTTVGQFAFWESVGPGVSVAVGVAFGLLLIPLFRVSRWIGRRVVFGRRASMYEVLSEFSERVGDTYATDDVLPRMAQILAQGAGADVARVWLHVGTTLRPEAAWPPVAAAVDPVPLGPDVPEEIAGESVFEVRDRGEVLGALSVGMPASDPMNPSKEKLVRDLAAQAGLVLRNVRLIEELRASRQRIVAAQDEERRRIERNLHDGAQQQLVALAVQLKLARAMVERDPERAGTMLDALQGSAGDALEELRDLARGIYPPLLADRGLAAALEAQARKAPVRTSIDADDVGRYPQEVETAVYFCALEALNNVAKYAGATRAVVSLSQEDGTLTLRVSDDGVGFDPGLTSAGTGLQGMADRLEAIGGELVVDSEVGAGTTVRGRIPTIGRRS
jgi:signal transduction histidine kinase